MNTPDGAPKNGDFVAYLAELEQRQSHGRPAATGPAAKPSPTEAATGATRTAAEVAKVVPIGLSVIGFALLVAGLAFNGGLILVLLGAFLLWQAVRAGVRRTGGEPGAQSQAVGRIAALLAQAQRKNRPGRGR